VKGFGGEPAKIIGTLLKGAAPCQPEMNEYSFFFREHHSVDIQQGG
jgi:hypothetical protein